jgi:Tol biopolymer transport system component/predicted Ser/Thr protein kinase
VERWQRIEHIFHEALGRDESARESYVSEACHGDGELFREVSSLLANHGDDEDFESWAPAAAAQLVVEQALLEPGHRLGPYRIDEFLAAGGMGQVYRATDTRLNREVAIKVSAARFSERFETEARAVASMNHPNICQLYDVGPNYLVMELVDGPTLADRIRRGPLPVSEALGIARQIAEALEAAHEKGSVHRDLKPANIKTTADGVVKLLDFGLAEIPKEPSTTDPGTIAGTPAYMSPEQARGDAVDKRGDIWAFGAVLYELLSGKAAFAGHTTSEILETVQRAEPDWSALPATTPARVRTLLRRCLERDRRQRLRDIGEARIVIDASEAAPAHARSILRPWLVAGVLIVLVVGSVAWWRATRSATPHAAMRLSVELDSDVPLAKDGFQTVLAIAPDDRRLVFTTRGADGVTKLAMRILDQGRSTVLSGTEDAEGPFFSPDGEWIGFFADGKLKKISVRGGTPVSLGDAPGSRGASWGEDGNIIAVLSLGTLSRIPAAGGRFTPVAEASHPNGAARWPQVLPGGQAVLFNSYRPGEDPENARIEILSFATGTRKTVARGYFPRYLRSGHLIFVRQNTLFAAPFDLGRLELRGTPQPMLDEISGGTKSGARHLDVSNSGTLVYLSGTERIHEVIAWLDGDGKVEPLRPEAGEYYQPRFSPDGKHLAFATATAHGMEIWVQDLDRGTASPRTFLPGRSWWPLWMPQGDRILFTSDNENRGRLYSVRADGSGQAKPLPETTAREVPRSISPDGKRLAFDTESEIWIAPIEGDAEHPRLGAGTKFLDAATPIPEAQFSPDGRWIAYVSAELGSSDVFVQPYPGTGGRWQISNGSGRFPIWSQNGHELFFLGPDHRIRGVEYTVDGHSFSPGKPRVWSETRVADLGVNSAYDLAPDGKRFAAILNADQAGESNRRANVTVLVNFADELRQRLGKQ